MIKKVGIFYLARRRPHAVDIFINLIRKTTNKENIKIYFLCDKSDSNNHAEHYSTDRTFFDRAVNFLSTYGIESECVCLFEAESPINYLSKIEYALASQHEYCIKMDEDVFLSSKVIDFMIDNCEILNDRENLLLSPVISNGIPTCDFFMQDFLEQEERDIIESLFLKTTIGPMWGVDYRALNAHTIEAKSWNSTKFYESVAKIGPDLGNHYYKGIHPVRINFEATKLINNFVINKWHKFINPSDMSIEIYDLPYFCNSLFLIKTDVWRQIIDRKDLFRDVFDEVPLNLYKELYDKKWVFIRNGYCIHILYNTIFDKNYENSVIEDIRKITT